MRGSLHVVALRSSGFAFVVASILFATAAHAVEEPGARSFALPSHGAITLAVPDSWRETIRQPPGELPPTIELAPSAGDAFVVMITPLWKQDPAIETQSLEQVRRFVEETGNEALKIAVEKDLAIVPIEGPEFSGYFFSLTDRTTGEGPPEAGEYRHMTQGAGRLGDLLVTFTILTHKSDDPGRNQALEMLKGSRRVAATEAAPPPVVSSLRKLTYPGKSWSLVLDLPGFELDKRETRPDGTGLMVMGSNKESGLIFSVFLEKAAKAGDAIACRQHYWKKAKRSPLPMKNVLLTERGDMALVEYLIPEFQGIKADQKNVNAYMSHDDVWIDIHVSKVRFIPEDWRLFETLLSSVKIMEQAAAAR